MEETKVDFLVCASSRYLRTGEGNVQLRVEPGILQLWGVMPSLRSSRISKLLLNNLLNPRNNPDTRAQSIEWPNGCGDPIANQEP